MDLAIAKQKLIEAEGVLTVSRTAQFAVFDTPHGKMQITVTDRLRKKCKKGKSLEVTNHVDRTKKRQVWVRPDDFPQPR